MHSVFGTWLSTVCRLPVCRSWQDVYETEDYKIYNHETTDLKGGYYVYNAVFSDLSRSAIKIKYDSNKSPHCEFLIEDSAFTDIICHSECAVFLHYIGSVAQRKIIAHNIISKDNTMTEDSTYIGDIFKNYYGHYALIYCQLSTVQRNEFIESCLDSCGSADADEYPGGQIVLRCSKVISKSCNISNGKAQLAAMCIYPYYKNICSVSFLIEYNNTSFNPKSPDGYYALNINGFWNSDIRFDHCEIIYNIAYYVVCSSFGASAYFDNCTFINPAAHTLFIVQENESKIYASNCYANHYIESTLIGSNGNISYENMTDLDSIRIPDFELRTIIVQKCTCDFPIRYNRIKRK